MSADLLFRAGFQHARPLPIEAKHCVIRIYLLRSVGFEFANSGKPAGQPSMYLVTPFCCLLASIPWGLCGSLES